MFIESSVEIFILIIPTLPRVWNEGAKCSWIRRKPPKTDILMLLHLWQQLISEVLKYHSSVSSTVFCDYLEFGFLMRKIQPNLIRLELNFWMTNCVLLLTRRSQYSIFQRAQTGLFFALCHSKLSCFSLNLYSQLFKLKLSSCSLWRSGSWQEIFRKFMLQFMVPLIKECVSVIILHGHEFGFVSGDFESRVKAAF